MSDALYPLKLKQGLTEQHVGAELLLYNEQNHQAYCLNRTTAAVWQQCDGTSDVAAISRAASLALGTPVTEAAVECALADLARQGLLAPSAAPMPVPAGVLSRRTMMGGLGTGALLLVPAIAVIVAPPAAQAYSGCFNCAPIPSSAPQDRTPAPTAAASQRRPESTSPAR